MRLTFFVAFVLAVSSMAACRDTHGPAPKPISEAIRASWNDAKRNMMESVDVMPEADFWFKPEGTGPDVRTFGAIIAHVAGANYAFCAAAKGEKTPHAEDAFEKTVKTKTDVGRALAGSLNYCAEAYSRYDDSTAGDLIEMPFGMGTAPRASALIRNVAHVNEHYGNLVTYFRAKGMVPPSSRR